MNTSDMTRVSFDFRIVNSDKDLGYKPISNYYRYDDLTSDKKEIEESTDCQKNNSKASYLTLIVARVLTQNLN